MPSLDFGGFCISRTAGKKPSPLWLQRAQSPQPSQVVLTSDTAARLVPSKPAPSPTEWEGLSRRQLTDGSFGGSRILWWMGHRAEHLTVTYCEHFFSFCFKQVKHFANLCICTRAVWAHPLGGALNVCLEGKPSSYIYSTMHTQGQFKVHYSSDITSKFGIVQTCRVSAETKFTQSIIIIITKIICMHLSSLQRGNGGD